MDKSLENPVQNLWKNLLSTLLEIDLWVKRGFVHYVSTTPPPSSPALLTVSVAASTDISTVFHVIHNPYYYVYGIFN